MFQQFFCLLLCILKCGVHFSCGTFLPSPISPYENNIAYLAINTQINHTGYPLNVTIGHQNYSVLLPTLSANNLSQTLQGIYNGTTSVNKPLGNNTRESRHLLHHLFHGLSHGGIKAASGSVSATHSFNLFGKQFNYAMGLSYGKPYYHVVSEVPGPYPYPNPGPDPTPPPEPAATDSPDGSGSDDNDDNDDDDDGSDSPDESDEDGDNNNDDDNDDDDDASVSNYSKKSDEQSGCGKRKGNSHGCNASGSYENLINKKKIRKGTERPVTTNATRKKKLKNKPMKVPEKLHKLEPTTKDNIVPLDNRQFSRNGVQISNEIDMPSTLWDLFYSSNRKSKDVHFPRQQGTANQYLLSADKLKQLSKISKITM